MAQTLASALSAKQKALADTRSAATQSLLRTFFSYWQQHKGNNDIQFVAISGLQSADVVLSDVAGKLLALFLKKPTASTVSAWAKISDHATVAAAAAELVLYFIGAAGGGQELCVVFPNGEIFGTGMTLGSHTANNGNSKSLIADAPVGFAIVGP